MTPTTAQLLVLARIQRGLPVRDTDPTTPEPLEVISYQHSRDGNAIVAHRTVRTTQTGNPRLDYRVEMYRIQRDGTVARL